MKPTISFALSGPRTNRAVERASASRAVGAATDTADNSTFNAGAGNDTISNVSSAQEVRTSKGDDTISGNNFTYRISRGDGSQDITVNLEEGFSDDGFGTTDNISGVSSNIILGQAPPCGTGTVNVTLDEELYFKYLSEIQDKECPIKTDISFDVDD